MKDIDFDELDKAVSSILGDQSAKSAPTPPPHSEIPPQPSLAAIPPRPAPAPVATVTVNAPPPPPVPPAVVPLPVSSAVPTSPITSGRRSGRFMDVVHPSSDMKGDEPPRATPPPSSNRTLQPLSSHVVPDPLKEPAPSPATQPLPPAIPAVQQPNASTLVSTEDTADTVWPDPLDIPTEPLLAAPEAMPALTPGPVPTPETPDATQSPFLSDAKVEKRPLGAYNTTEPADTTPTPEAIEPAVASADGLADGDNGKKLPDDSQLTPQALLPTNEPLPRELDNDLVALESGDQATTQPADDTPALSLPAQPKSPERSVEPGDHPVFDTTDYHAPLPTATPGKKPAIGKVWLIVLLVALVAIGAVAYLWLSGIIDFSRLI